MSNDLKHTIYNPTDCLSEKMLFDYIDNKLSQKERHIVEKHLLDCEMCSDALEGLEMVKDRNRIVLIKEAINKKILSSTEKEAVVVSFNYKMAFSIAATVALLIVGVFFFKNIGLKESSMGDMAELTKEESAPPPPPPPPPSDESGNIVTESEDGSGSTVAGIKSESNGLTSSKVIDQEIALAEEQKPGVYKSAEGSGETRNEEAPVEAVGNATVYYDATVAKPDDDRKNNNQLETVTIPKTSASEREKYSKLEDKKAAEKTVTTGATGGTFAWNTTPEQKQKNTADNTKQSGDQVDLAKKTESGGKYRSESKEKGKRDKEPSKLFSKDSRSDENKNVGGVVSAPQSAAQDADELKSEVDANTSTTTMTDSVGQVFTIVEQMPEYPGGNVALANDAMKEIRLLGTVPRDDDGQISTTIMIEFIVNSSGKAVQPKLVKPKNNSELQKQVAEFVNKMPLWKPGKQDNKNVAVKMVLPIKINPK